MEYIAIINESEENLFKENVKRGTEIKEKLKELSEKKSLSKEKKDEGLRLEDELKRINKWFEERFEKQPKMESLKTK